ncbi:unnamed protein product [Staurois parvus]|uniref:Uncharacterized protein n=1 Tax=Staurois parvus TaxID=386267 RepID=A0ABN9H4L5_9NEOB|nr:unnamed protein product [Staurois parvus]
MKHLEHETRLRGGCPADWVCGLYLQCLAV